MNPSLRQELTRERFRELTSQNDCTKTHFPKVFDYSQFDLSTVVNTAHQDTDLKLNKQHCVRFI